MFRGDASNWAMAIGLSKSQAENLLRVLRRTNTLTPAEAAVVAMLVRKLESAVGEPL